MKVFPKISVIVPVYNVQEYITQCVDSILNQTYKNLEIILIDDGSIDNSGQICDDYSLIDSRVVVIHQKNHGLSGARNTGIKAANGEYLCFVDSDDYVVDSFVQQLYDGIIKSNALISECHVNKFINGDEVLVYKDRFKEKMLKSSEWLTEHSLSDFYSCTVWNKMYYRTLFDDVEFPIGRNFEDESTTYKLVYKSGFVYRTYQRLYNYRIREDSITTSKMTEQSLKNKLLSLKERFQFFEERGERKLADFSCAKHSINMISAYINNSDIFSMAYATLDDSMKELRQYLYRILTSSVVPLKYKLYIVCNYFRLCILRK